MPLSSQATVMWATVMVLLLGAQLAFGQVEDATAATPAAATPAAEVPAHDTPVATVSSEGEAPLVPLVSPMGRVFSRGSIGVATAATGGGHMKARALVKDLYAPAPAQDTAGSTATSGDAAKVAAWPWFSFGSTCSPKPVGGCGNGIKFHSGSVMKTINLYPIFYGTFTAANQTIINNFLTGLGGSTWWGITAQYSDGTGNVPKTLTVKPSYKYPSTTVANTVLGSGGVQTIVKDYITNVAKATDLNGLYLVLTGSDITEGVSGDAFCANYCGWHNKYSASAGTVKYAFVGNPAKCPTSCIPSKLLDSNSVPNNAVAPSGDSNMDGLISVLAHEIAEAASDPMLQQWYDSNGNENADKCAWTYGTIQTNAAGRFYNTCFNDGRCYLIQQNWLVNGGACALKV